MHNFGGGYVGFIQFRGRWSKGGEGIFSKFRGELAKRGVKKFRGGGEVGGGLDPG